MTKFLSRIKKSVGNGKTNDSDSDSDEAHFETNTTDKKGDNQKPAVISISHTSSTASATSSFSDYDNSLQGEEAMSSTGADVYDEQGNKQFVSRLLKVKNKHRWELQGSILDCIGNTPIVPLRRMAPPNNVKIYLKIESCNPGGSLKDRLAMGVIEFAEQKGHLKPGQTVIEASSGNAGIGLAMVCAAKGYPFVCVMSESFSIERRKVMRFLGARVILTKAEHKATGMLVKAEELADKHGFFYPKQFESEANAWIHEQTTGAEICRAFCKANKPLDHFFMAYGTGGAVLGISRAFRKAHMPTKVHLCEPSNAAMVSSCIPTKYPAPETNPPSTSFDTAHPVWSPHHLQGWATDFIPKLVDTCRKEGGYHQIAQVSSASAMVTARALAFKEGIFTGTSGGGIVAAALSHAQICPPGTTILCMIPDTGERYLSTELFEGIPVEMTKEEQELSATTPGHAPPPPPALSGVMPANTDELFDL